MLRNHFPDNGALESLMAGLLKGQDFDNYGRHNFDNLSDINYTSETEEKVNRILPSNHYCVAGKLEKHKDTFYRMCC